MRFRSSPAPDIGPATLARPRVRATASDCRAHHPRRSQRVRVADNGERRTLRAGWSVREVGGKPGNGDIPREGRFHRLLEGISPPLLRHGENAGHAAQHVHMTAHGRSIPPSGRSPHNRSGNVDDRISQASCRFGLSLLPDGVAVWSPLAIGNPQSHPLGAHYSV
jgi:hypothetical protein